MTRQHKGKDTTTRQYMASVKVSYCGGMWSAGSYQVPVFITVSGGCWTTSGLSFVSDLCGKESVRFENLRFASLPFSL